MFSHKTVHSLIKFSQQRKIFVCDYVAMIKVYQGQLYGLYNDPYTCLVSNAFKDFKDMLDCKHGIVTLNWIASKIDLNMVGIECWLFNVVITMELPFHVNLLNQVWHTLLSSKCWGTIF